MPLKLGMLGMWHTHADGIVRQVAEHPKEFTLSGFHDPDPRVVTDRRKQWESKLSHLRVFDSPEQLLREPLDGVVVEGRVHENLKWARLALESGRPVMLEKPAGTDLAEYRRLVDLVVHFINNVVVSAFLRQAAEAAKKCGDARFSQSVKSCRVNFHANGFG